MERATPAHAPETSQLDQLATNQQLKQRKQKIKRKRAVVTCRLCGERMAKVTAEHLSAHAYTLASYARTFPEAPSTPPADIAQARDIEAQARTVGQALLGSSDFAAHLADDVAVVLASGPQRKQLLLAVSSLLATRLEAHGRAVAAFESVRRELSRPERLERGENGVGPATTRDLVAIGQLLRAEVQQGEEMLLKTVKLAIEEGRSDVAKRDLAGGHPLDRYAGDAEAIPVPAALSAGERETIRSLLGVLARPGRAQVLQLREVTMTSTPAAAATADAHAQSATADRPRSLLEARPRSRLDAARDDDIGL